MTSTQPQGWTIEGLVRRLVEAAKVRMSYATEDGHLRLGFAEAKGELDGAERALIEFHYAAIAAAITAAAKIASDPGSLDASEIAAAIRATIPTDLAYRDLAYRPRLGHAPDCPSSKGFMYCNCNRSPAQP